MALFTKFLSGLLQKSTEIRCCCGVNLTKTIKIPSIRRFASINHRINAKLNQKWYNNHRLIYGLGFASVTAYTYMFMSDFFDVRDITGSLGLSTLGKVIAAERPPKDSPRYKWNFIADAVEKAAPAVVHITIRARNPYSGQLDVTSSGSGFITRSDGLIVTNAHVVANKASITVKLSDGTTYVGHVQAVDPVSDLATLKIDATNLPVLPLGRSGELRSGEWVIALGSPLQLSNTVTTGVVSTANRGSEELGLHHKDMNYIQTDAVINFGNSGGPLVNLDGEAVGVNSMKVTAGISFAIPSDYVKDFLEKAEKIEKRSETKSWFGGKLSPTQPKYLGITMVTLTPELIHDIRLRQHFPDVKYGVLVHRIIVGSPAHVGGMEAGDVILKINNKEVHTSTDVYKAVETGEKLKLLLQRDSEKIIIEVTPGLIE